MDVIVVVLHACYRSGSVRFTKIRAVMRSGLKRLGVPPEIEAQFEAA
jgi:hypothetical protein